MYQARQNVEDSVEHIKEPDCNDIEEEKKNDNDSEADEQTKAKI